MDEQDKQKLIEFFKQHVSINVRTDSYREYYSSGIKVVVDLVVDGEVVSSSYDTYQLESGY